MVEVTRRIRWDGRFEGKSYYSTPSWTTRGVEYTLTVNWETGAVKCSCMDASCRKKVAYALDDQGQGGCKHIRALCCLMGEALKREREIAT